MSKLLIYIGEGIKFDIDKTIRIIKDIDGVTEARSGDFIGAVFECLFARGEVVIRISKDVETITTDGPAESSVEFLLRLQERLQESLSVIDMNYSFNFKVGNFSSADELLRAMESA